MHPDGSLGLALRPLRPDDIHRHPKYLFQHLPQAGLSCYCASNPLMISFVGSESGVWGGNSVVPHGPPDYNFSHENLLLRPATLPEFNYSHFG